MGGPQPGRWAGWNMALAAQAVRYWREQSGTRQQRRISPLLRVLAGTWKQDCLLWVHGGGSQEPGTPVGLSGDAKAGLARNERWSWRRGRKDRSPASQIFLKQEQHKHFHPSLMHKASADPHTVSEVLACFPNFHSAGLHNLQSEK